MNRTYKFRSNILWSIAVCGYYTVVEQESANRNKLSNINKQYCLCGWCEGDGDAVNTESKQKLKFVYMGIILMVKFVKF